MGRNSNIWLFSIFVVGFFAVILISRLGKKTSSSKADGVSREFQLKRKQYIFTRSEKAFYRLLLEALENSEITVFAQMKLIDLFLSPSGKDAQWMRNKLMSKHVDFVLIGWPDGTPLVVVELDGASHNSKVQQARDADKDAALASAEIPLLRVRTDEIMSALELKKRLAQYIPGLLALTPSSVGRG